MGELIASALIFSSLGRAAFAPRAHFPINRHARESEEGFQGSEGEGIERKEKEEEERRGNEVEALPNHNRDQIPTSFLVLHSFFVVLRSSTGKFPKSNLSIHSMCP